MGVDFQLRATGDLPEEVTAQMGPQVDGEDVRLLRLREQAWWVPGRKLEL